MNFFLVSIFFCPFHAFSGTNSTIPENTVANTSLQSFDNPDSNSGATINALSFDSLTGQIRISYCIDSSTISSNSDLEIVIAYGDDHFPQMPTGFPVNPVLSYCTDTIIPLLKPLRFDTLYYVSLWLRQPGGAWFDPTESSRDTVRIGKPFKQMFHLFDPDKPVDTISVFNGSVLLWKDHLYTEKSSSEYTMQIHHSYVPPSGMRAISSPFSFVNADPVLPFYIGFPIDSIPAGRSINDVRIYTDSAGNTSVIYETVVDSAHGIVYFKTDNLRPTFVAMLDTAAPSATILDKDHSSPIASTASLHDTVAISDNISNARYRFYFGKGNEVPPLRESATLSDKAATIILTVSDTSHAISSEFGLRAWLVVTDGVHADTVDLSRAVQRAESDPMTTIEKTWNPVYPTARLFHKEADSLIARLSNHDTIGYNPRYMRLYRWIEYDGNRDSTSKWVEYDTANMVIKTLFTLEPGTMVWLKTRENMPLHLDSGYTLSPGDTFSVTLPAHQWTDLGMPFRFGVPLSAVFAATGSDADYIDICRWKADDENGLFSLEPLFIHGRANQSGDALLEYNSRGGYSFYNQKSQPVTLRIPSTLAALVAAKTKELAKRHVAQSAWGVSFCAITAQGAHLPPVYCGYAAGMAKRSVTAGPSFQTMQVLLAERENRRLCAYSIGEEYKQGFAREVLIRNTGDCTQTISWKLETAGNLPESHYTAVYDPATGTVGQSGSFTVEKRSAVSRFIITGDAAFHEKFRAAMLSLQYRLHAPYPNPARSVVTIRYTVPAGSQERVNVSIYSVAGRLVWSKDAGGFLKSGVNTLVWNGHDRSGQKTASGVYVIRLDVMRQNGTRMKHFEQRMTFLR